MQRQFALFAATLLTATSIALTFAAEAQAGRWGGRMTKGDCDNIGGTWTGDGTTNTNGDAMGICN